MHETTLSELRSFLIAQDIAPAAWSPGQDVLDAMYAALRTRRDDDVFWAEVRGLLRRVEDRGIRTALQGKAEVLEPETIDALVRALRISLPATHQADTGWKSMGRLRPLAAFLALGLAVGCGDKATDEDDGDDLGGSGSGSSDLCEAAQTYVQTGDRAEVFCELVEAVQGSELSTSDQNALIECVADQFSEAQMQEVIDAFEALEDDLALAEYVDGLLEDCDGEGSDDGDGTH